VEVNFTIHPSARLVTYSANGTPDIHSARQFFDEVVAAPGFETGFAFLGDCRGLDRDPDSAFVRAVASEVRARSKELGPCRWGLVFSTAGGFAATRVCGLLTYGSGVEFEPFLTPSDAAGWVGEGSPERRQILSSR
jgi:hypothetical protein